MATHSRIGIVNGDGSITSIYCHWDGHVDENGATLLRHYTSEEKVRALLALGDLSTLGQELGERGDRGKAHRRGGVWCHAYGRDMGEAGAEAVNSDGMPSFVDLARASKAQCAYLFSANEGRWSVAWVNREKPLVWSSLDDEMALRSK